MLRCYCLSFVLIVIFVLVHSLHFHGNKYNIVLSQNQCSSEEAFDDNLQKNGDLARGYTSEMLLSIAHVIKNNHVNLMKRSAKKLIVSESSGDESGSSEASGSGVMPNTTLTSSHNNSMGTKSNKTSLFDEENNTIVSIVIFSTAVVFLLIGISGYLLNQKSKKKKKLRASAIKKSSSLKRASRPLVSGVKSEAVSMVSTYKPGTYYDQQSEYHYNQPSQM